MASHASAAPNTTESDRPANMTPSLVTAAGQPSKLYGRVKWLIRRRSSGVSGSSSLGGFPTKTGPASRSKGSFSLERPIGGGVHAQAAVEHFPCLRRILIWMFGEEALVCDRKLSHVEWYKVIEGRDLRRLHVSSGRY